MANFTLEDVKNLRERLGTGMVDTKNALVEADGDLEKAVEILRLKGAKGNAKRADRSTAEGLVAAVDNGDGTATLIELACETDFVAKGDKFVGLADRVLAAVAAARAETVEAALAAPAEGKTVADVISEEAAILGEKVELRRIRLVKGEHFSIYLHKTSKDLPPQVGVVLGYAGADAETARSVAQHISFANPEYLTREDVPADAVEKERAIVEQISREEGKPEAALPKIIEGRLGAYFKQVALLEQDYAKDNKLSVGKVLADAGLTVSDFARFTVGASQHWRSPDRTRYPDSFAVSGLASGCRAPTGARNARDPALRRDRRTSSFTPKGKDRSGMTERKRRVMLKLSGEAFGGGALGVNPDVVSSLAREIADAARTVEVAIVVGGGNFFRGAELSQRGMDRGRADYMGMLGTVMNSLALQDFLEQAGAETRVQSAISMTQVAEPYIPRRAERHLEKGRVVIFGAGAGLPYFSTDTVAAQRALEIGADVVLVAKNGVDGVYSDDPRTNPDAHKIDRISYQEALQRGLKVVDSTAFSLCMDNGMPMQVFGMEPAGNVTQAILGTDLGTIVSNGEPATSR